MKLMIYNFPLALLWKIVGITSITSKTREESYLTQLLVKNTYLVFNDKISADETMYKNVKH